MNYIQKKIRHTGFILLPFLLLLVSCKKDFEKPEPPAGFYVFGGPGNEDFYDVLEAGTGEFILVGSDEKQDDNYDIFIAKVNQDGDLLDSVTIDKGGNEIAYRIIPWQGGYAVAGWSKSGTSYDSDVFLLFLNSELEEISFVNNFYFPSSYSNGRFTTFLNAGDGNLFFISSGNSSSSIIKVTPTGIILKELSFIHHSYMPVNSNFVQIDSSNWVVSMRSDSGGIQLRSYDKDLNPNWSSGYNSQYYESSGPIYAANGKIYTTYQASGFPLRVQQFSQAGVFEKEFTFSEGGTPSSISFSQDGRIWIAGSRGNPEPYSENTNGFLISTDTSGSSSAMIENGGEREELIRCMIISSSGQKIIGGCSDSYGEDGSSAWVWIQN